MSRRRIVRNADFHAIVEKKEKRKAIEEDKTTMKRETCRALKQKTFLVNQQHNDAT